MKARRCKTCHFKPCRCLDLEAGYMGQSCTTTCWPLLSEAMAVHPKQVKEAQARAKRHGINVVYQKDGRVLIPDRAERKRLLKLEGFHDKQGGYGD